MEDPRGVRWSVEGALAVIDATVRDGRLETPGYPDALARVWSALTCPTSGEVLLSAAPGYEFIDWGRQAHVGGGSHGSLHASDSLGALVMCGVAPPPAEPAQWAIRDIAPIVLGHFGLGVDASSSNRTPRRLSDDLEVGPLRRGAPRQARSRSRTLAGCVASRY